MPAGFSRLSMEKFLPNTELLCGVTGSFICEGGPGAETDVERLEEDFMAKGQRAEGRITRGKVAAKAYYGTEQTRAVFSC